MGGHNSKLTLEAEAEAVPPQVRSLLQRRFEETESRTKGRKLKASNSFSKKQQLKDGDQEEVDESLPHLVPSSPEFENLPSPKIPPKMDEKKSKVAPIMPESDKGTKQTDEDQNKDQIKRGGTELSVEDNKEAKGVNVYIGGVFAMEETTEGEEDDEDDDDGMLSNSEICTCPASPSFRIYCMEPSELDNDNSKNDSTDDDIKHQKSLSAESADCIFSVASMTDHNDGQATKTKKKGRRRRRIRKALSMGGPNAVKNLLNVKGCYNPGCAGGHHRSTYVTHKSAASSLY